MSFPSILGSVTFLLIVPLLAFGQPEDRLEVGPFSLTQPDGPFPEGWEPLLFEKIPEHTHYQLIQDDGTLVVKATSHQSASGLTKKTMINPKEFPIIQWRWKVQNILQKGNVYSKQGDDYPARLYITFEYDGSKIGFFERAKYEAAKILYGQYPPLGAISYIWASNSSVGTITPNAFTDRVQMVVVQNGSPKLNQWVTEERNVLEDYRKAFGTDPPNISGVAIMSDTDNTRESAVAFFGDITFKKAPNPALPPP